MSSAERFRDLRRADALLLLMPNAWDVGSARMLEHLGFSALATTSGGAATSRGVLDGGLDVEMVHAHCAELAAAVKVPVSADLENGFATDALGVAATFERARDIGLAGASIEDWSGSSIYGLTEATERVHAAVQAAAGELIVTARAENHFRGHDDLEDTITRLQAFEQVGADVLFAPGISSPEQLRAVLAEVSRPVNVLAGPDTPPVDELHELGVRRLSIGASFAFTAYAAMADAAHELLTRGTYDYTHHAARGRALARDALTTSCRTKAKHGHEELRLRHHR